MKRSAHVTAPLLAAAALATLTGCRPQMQRCVDENNNVVADSLCKDQTAQRRPDGHGGFIIIPYRYYYGGTGSYTAGTHVGGGSFTPSAGASYSTTTRGGFGSSFGGGEGGHGGSGGE